MIQRVVGRSSGAHDVHRLRDDLASALGETDRLRTQLEQMTATNRNLSALLLTTDTRSGEMLKLLVSVRSLIASRDAAAALAGLQDILVNVVGSADFLIYSLDDAGDCLTPIACVGAPLDTSARLPLRSSWLGDVVRAGEVLIAHQSNRFARSRMIDAAAVVPLKVLDRVLGAIVIAGVLPHRRPLDLHDRDLLGLLGAYAATAIIAADQRGEWSQLPVVIR